MNVVERDEEFSIMEGMLGATVAGQGGALLVSGVAASGKTALLRAFGARAHAAGALLMQATASDVERDMPLGVMGQLLLGAELPDVDATRAARLVDLVAVTVPTRRARVTLPATVVNVITELSGIIIEKAKERPVVLVIDDVHHADPYSLEGLLYLARRLDASRILMLLGESGSGLSGNTGSGAARFQVDLLRVAGCRHIRLGPLTRRGVAELAAACGGHGRRWWGTRPLVAELHRIGGGNPLLTRALIEDGRGPGAGSGEGGPADLVPGEAFEQAVTMCLYRSDTATRNAAWALAVLGPHAAHAELAEVLGVSRESAHRGLDALRAGGLLGSGWFRHEAGRAAVLRSMEPTHRAHLEARVAEVLHDHGHAATVVVRHLIQAGPIEAAWALPTLLEAAERALADDEVGLALACLRVARASCADERRSLEIRAALTRAARRVNPATAAQHLPALTAGALAGRVSTRHAAELVGHLLWFGQVDQATAVLRAAEKCRAAGAAPGAGTPHRLDDVRLWLAYEYPGLPRPARAADEASWGAGPARSAHERAATLVRAVLDGAGDDVVVRAEQTLQGTRLDDGTVPALVVALNALILADRLDKAAYWSETLFKEATARSAPMWQAQLASVKARVEVRLGGLAAADRSAHTAITLVPAEGWGVALAAPVALAVYAKTALGRLDAAAAHLCVPVPEMAFHTPDGLVYLWARGHYYLAAGRPYAALDDFRTCGDLMTCWDLDLPGLVPWRTDAAQAQLALGDERRAHDLAEEQLALVGPGAAWTRGVSLRVLARTLPAARRPPLLEEAVEILRESGHRLELARATDELARAHRELGGAGQARSLARKAQQLARECGVPAPAAPRPADPGTPLGGDGAWAPPAAGRPVELSDAELRVATLAARGHTNRQIADKLFITISTVEQHLTRAYRKLDVQRRTDLTEKIRPAAGSGTR
ncbi:Oxygen regulatory protein NreC [Streptomyces sp. YIM 121038]|uniref:helix-turn-helix transcriptional regulator n=1 Tax=Streptomyces sp. YIM 121038 TaxID=2136401 RepID=UPI001162806A|nr:LuxR family transcriptional regulator [Streptomyces sp. YIM 121038]QCX74852.1 Oxygen regulatory protein NreC [Streptomyces sp. YIM 121038]